MDTRTDPLHVRAQMAVRMAEAEAQRRAARERPAQGQARGDLGVGQPFVRGSRGHPLIGPTLVDASGVRAGERQRWQGDPTPYLPVLSPYPYPS